MEHEFDDEEKISFQSENLTPRTAFNRTKWIVVAVAIASIAMLGMMIASVVIGAEITKDLYIGERNELISAGGKDLVKTSMALYNYPLSVFTPLPVLEGVKSVDVNVSVDGIPSVYHMEVVSFLYVPARKLILYGITHQVEIGVDGILKLQPLNGNIVETSRRRKVDSVEGTLLSGTLSSTLSSVEAPRHDFVLISACNDLLKIEATGSYLLINDLTCTLSGPLLFGVPFTGIFDGLMNSLHLTINCDSDAGLFHKFGGVIQDLNIYGDIQGCGYVGAFGAHLLGGSISSCGSYATITSNHANRWSRQGSPVVVGAGGFFGSSDLIDIANFQSCVSQGSISAVGSPVANFAAGFIAAFIYETDHSLNFQGCLSVPVSCDAIDSVDPFCNPVNSSMTITQNETPTSTLNCQNCYFDEIYRNCFCSAAPAPNNWLTCPPVNYGQSNFQYSCLGNNHPTSAPTSAPTAVPITFAPNSPTTAPTSAPTSAPTTECPTTEAPTTECPTTKTPTSSPTTFVPNSPTTAPTSAPTTECPTTEAPTTKTTSSPTSSPTEIPTTASPTGPYIPIINSHSSSRGLKRSIFEMNSVWPNSVRALSNGCNCRNAPTSTSNKK